MLEYKVLHISNGTLLFSGSRMECEYYCRKNNYYLVKFEGEYDEYIYVD